MKRRDFFKGLAGVIAGFAIAPIVVKEIKETPNEWEKALRKVTDYSVKHPYELEGSIVNPSEWECRGGWNCHGEHISKFELWTDAVPDGWTLKLI